MLFTGLYIENVFALPVYYHTQQATHAIRVWGDLSYEVNIFHDHAK
jgi:hypothetical protein